MRLAPLAWALGSIAPAWALPQITRTGKYLYDPSGNRFFIKAGPLPAISRVVGADEQGVAYQPEGMLAASSEANANK